MLNMTHIEVAVESSGAGTLTLNVDLGQSLMSPIDYWTAAQLAEPARDSRLARALAQLEKALRLYTNGQPVTLSRQSVHLQAESLEAVANPLAPQMAVIEYSFAARSPTGAIEVSLKEGIEVPWPGLVRLDVAGNPLPQSRVLTAETRNVRFASLNGDHGSPLDKIVTGWAGIAPQATWVAIGFQHIVPYGLDHMLFILGLFFLAGGWRVLLLQVTCFTLAHSLTLALSSLGYITAPSHLVEPLIALSIVYVAIDNLFADRLARFRLAVISSFGLLHGMGFAAVLSDIGLPQDGLVTALALFNVGVELGQIAVLLAAFAIVGWWRKQVWYEHNIAAPATVAIAGTGLYWFIKRVAF